MKKQFSWIALFIAISLISCIFGCKEPEIETDTKAPANVTKLTVTAADGNAVLTWKNPTDADFDGVQVSMSPAEGTLKNAIMLGKDVVSLDVSGLTVGKEYTFTVKTIDTSNNKSSGVSAKVTVADYTAPADVTELTVQAENGNAVLNWKNPTDADFAGVQISMNPPEGTLLNPVSLGKDVTSFDVSGLENGKEYTFTVKTVDTSGNKSAGVTKTITPSIIEKSVLQITLEPNTTERTNKDVVITVNATTDSASKIKKITYVEGTESNIDTVLAGTNITETKQITATENTTFTVAVTDTAGRCELAFVTVNNIDKAAPAQVANVMPSYSRSDNTIKLFWTNPADKDFAGTEIVYGKTDSEKTTTLTFDKNTTSATIKNIADDDSEYTITIKTKDDVGNFGEAKTVTVVATTGAKITSVNLDRTHLDSIMTNRDIEVTISGSNFDLLTSLLVQVTDGSKAETPVTATINKETNTATATVTAPVPASPTDNGRTYTVKVIVDSTTPAEKTATFVVSKPADVTKISLAKTQIPVGKQESVTATITGYNFDIRGVTKVKLLDSNGDEYTESTVTVSITNNTSNTEFTVDIPLPTTEGFYTVAVFFDDVKDTNTTTLQVYGTTIISEVIIPLAGTNYGGNVLPVTINGKNFTAPGVTVSGFTSTGATLTNVKIVSDTKATAEVACPYVVGTTNVTVSYGESSATGTLKVLAVKKCFVVGDVLLTDGTRIKAENVQYGLPSGKNAFAVIVSAPYGGVTGKAIGLQKGSSLKWAPSGTKGYNTNFKEIQVYNRYSANSGYTFEGDLDGSDNWEYICSIDPEGTQDAATNYPIFNFANTYGTTAGLTGTDYETGWYVPSVAEVYEVYKNKVVTQTSLDAAKGFTLGTSYYWSSSHYASSNYFAYPVDFSRGNVNYKDKFGSNNVFVLQAFNAEQFNNYEYNTEISSVEIPTIAEGFVGEVPVKIKGKDLIQKITVSGLTISTIDYISDAMAIAYVTTTGTETETTITVSCGESSATTTLKVIEPVASTYEVGDIILTDSSKVSVNDVTAYTVDENNKPIGVVAMISDVYGVPTPKVIGLQGSADDLRWASRYTTGYNTKFTNIVCIPSQTGVGTALTATFTGDTEGSDNWEEICYVDPEGTADAATNYPIFNFANTYGITAGLTDTDYENGWYVPSIAELCEVYKNKDVIQISLTKANGFKIAGLYWSSSQNASASYDAYLVRIYDGYVDYPQLDYKAGKYDVFVLQALTAK